MSHGSQVKDGFVVRAPPFDSRLSGANLSWLLGTLKGLEHNAPFGVEGQEVIRKLRSQLEERWGETGLRAMTAYLEKKVGTPHHRSLAAGR